MSIGIVELITLLTGISGLSVGTNPTAPTPQAALEYAMPDADVVAYADVGAIVPGNYKVLTNLANQPQIKASPELAKGVRQMVAEIEGPRGLVKGMTGIDLTTDVSDVTASFKYVPGHNDPDFVVAVHGKFTGATIDKVAKMANKQTVKVGTSVWFDGGDGTAAGVKNGVLLLGSTTLVKDRMADTWKAAAVTSGTNLGTALEVLNGKPVVALVVGMSAAARKEALDKNPGQNFLTDLVKRHKVASFSVHRDGLGWTWVDSTKVGLDNMGQISEGLVELMRAAQVAPRGFAKIVLGAVDSYKGTDKQIDDLIKNKAAVMKIVDTYTGDGNFKSQIDKDPKTLKLSVRLTGKSLSEVMPLGGLMPAGAAAWLLMRSSGQMKDEAPVLVTPPPLPPPAKKQGNASKHP